LERKKTQPSRENNVRANTVSATWKRTFIDFHRSLKSRSTLARIFKDLEEVLSARKQKIQSTTVA
jgi:hypothetical protein